MDEQEFDIGSTAPTTRSATGSESEGGGAPTKEQVMDALANVYDPELGINVVDLGLVYEVEIADGRAHITYTLTTMGCPIGPLIEHQMREAVLAVVPGVTDVEPEMVLRPAWSPEMMSDEAKAALGVF